MKKKVFIILAAAAVLLLLGGLIFWQYYNQSHPNLVLPESAASSQSTQTQTSQTVSRSTASAPASSVTSKAESAFTDSAMSDAISTANDFLSAYYTLDSVDNVLDWGAHFDTYSSFLTDAGKERLAPNSSSPEGTGVTVNEGVDLHKSPLGFRAASCVPNGDTVKVVVLAAVQSSTGEVSSTSCMVCLISMSKADGTWKVDDLEEKYLDWSVSDMAVFYQ